MSEFGDRELDEDRIDLGGVPAGEKISDADAAERVDEEPEEQVNRKDPVWDEEDQED